MDANEFYDYIVENVKWMESTISNVEIEEEAQPL